MRLFQTSARSSTMGTSSLEHYIGNMSEALIRAQAERDIRNARAAAEASIRARSSFLENMNHELRTPLNAIIGFTYMLKGGQDYDLSDEQKSSYAEYVLQSADLLLGHLNTILEVAALDNGSIQPDHEAVDATSLLEEVIKKINIQASAKQVKILTGSKGDANKASSTPEISMWADPVRVTQALDHLLQTAIKSCKFGGKVYVRVSTRRSGWAEIQIRDDGQGFSTDDLELALNAFGETHRGLSQPFTGPGVGVAIAKTFIEMQGGEFTIKSRVGKGTLSTISLPLATAGEGVINLDNQSEHTTLESKTAKSA